MCTWSERAWTCRRLPLGSTLSFRALCTAAVSISCSARFVEVAVQSICKIAVFSDHIIRRKLKDCFAYSLVFSTIPTE